MRLAEITMNCPKNGDYPCTKDAAKNFLRVIELYNMLNGAVDLGELENTKDRTEPISGLNLIAH